MVVVGSKSHRSGNDESYIKKLNVKDFISAHSSIKFCLIAEGVADIYPRFGPTMEWDIAAGQAILLAAGGRVIDAFSGDDFIYNKPEFRNGAFIAYGGIDQKPPLASK